jgi:hypothetical protein
VDRETLILMFMVNFGGGLNLVKVQQEHYHFHIGESASVGGNLLEETVKLKKSQLEFTIMPPCHGFLG